MTQEIDPEEVSLEPTVAEERQKGPAKVVQFFSGEDAEDFIDKESMLDLAEYVHSLKQSIKEATEKHDKAVAEIKKRLKVETLSKKHIENLGSRQILVTKRAGSVSFDAEKYIRDMNGDASWKELEETKAQVKEGKVDSQYFTRGKESVAVEVV